MLGTVRNYASVARYFAKLAIQRQLEYPLSLVSWVLMIPIQYFSGIWMIRILVDRFQPLAGWTFPQLAFVYGLGLLSHGLQVFLLIQSWQIEKMVNLGGFDRMIVRPLNVFFQFTVQSINFVGLIDLIPAVIIFLYACRVAGFQWTLFNTLKLIVVIFGATAIRAALFTMVGSVAFWTRRSFPLVMTCLQLFERGTLYPLSIYPYALQWVFTWLIPIGFISFYPASAFLGKNDTLQLPGDLALWTVAVGLVLSFLAYGVFQYGMRHYESAGS